MIHCSVLNCPNSFINNPGKVTFHAFPHDRDVLQYWINFTAKSNFFPDFNSKICSAHFEKDSYFRNSKTLKPEAYPTIVTGGKNSLESEDAHGRSYQKIQTSGSKKSSLSLIMNPNSMIHKIMLNRNLNENNMSRSLEVSNSKNMLNIVPPQRNFPLPTLPETNNTVVLNYKHNNFEAGPQCYVPLQIKVPVNLLRMQMPSAHKLRQNHLTSVCHPSSNSYKQPITQMQSQLSQKGPIKVVDMKKLLQPPQEDAKITSKKSTNEQDCEIVNHFIHSNERIPSKPHVNTKHKLETACTSTNPTNVDTLSTLNVPSKVTVSEVLDCLKVILPVKFDLSRLVPNDKVAALVIRYLKLQDDCVTKNSVIMYLRIIVDAARIKEKSASNDITHPYWRINDIALQLALEKVLPPKFAMTDVSTLVLNCLCIVLNQDVYVDGYHILRKLIRKLINEGQHCNEIPNQEPDVINLVDENGTSDGREEKQPLKKVKSSVAHTHSRKIDKLPQEEVSTLDVSVNKCEQFQSSFQTSLSKNKPAKLIVSRSQDAEKCKVNSEMLESQTSVIENLSTLECINNNPISKSVNPLKIPKKKNIVGKVRVKLVDKDWKIEDEIYNDKANKMSPKLKGAENIKAIKSYLRKQRCSPKDVLSTFRGMFYLCRFLCIKSRLSNLQKLNEILNLIEEMDRQKLTEEIIDSSKRSGKQKENGVDTYTKPLSKNHSCDKLKLKPVVVLHDLIDHETENMFFMKGNKNHSGYYDLRYCKQQNVSTKKYSSDHVNKLTCESYKMFRRIVGKRLGKKVVFRIKYSKLAPGSLVFVRDFRKPSLGWLKGSINKMVDSQKYVVQLGSGEIWWCAPEQLRPLPKPKETEKPITNLSPRSARVIKPRQLFDL